MQRPIYFACKIITSDCCVKQIEIGGKYNKIQTYKA